jgi:type II secretory pathway predicted ATPase ExeA
MAYLGYGLSQGEGFIVITGAPGAGKTTLVGHLMETIDPERLHVIKIVTTQVEAEDLLLMVAAGLNIDGTHLAKAQLLAAIEKQLHAVARQGRRTLLIADEAQALPLESLEELRMLSNFQAGGYPLLQIFLLGQPEFRARLSDPRLDQLRQRVIAMHALDPMGADELEPYLIHRLSCVGWRGKPRFTNDAVAAMYRWSGDRGDYELYRRGCRGGDCRSGRRSVGGDAALRARASGSGSGTPRGCTDRARGAAARGFGSGRACGSPCACTGSGH